MTVELFLHDWKNCADGTLAGVIQKAKDAGVGLIIKSDDGGNWYPQYVNGKNTPVSTLVAACEEAGVPASCWGYAYMDPQPVQVGNYLRQGVAAEAQRAIETIQIAKPRRYYCDNEAESEGRPVQGQYYVDTVNQAVAASDSTTELVSSCLPIVRYHQTGLYYQFGKLGGWTQAPQQYWCFWRGQPYGTGPGVVQWWEEDAKTFSIPISTYYPTYCDSPLLDGGISDTELTDYLAALTQKQCPVVSVWAYDGMDTAAWERVKRVVQWQREADPHYQAEQLIAQAKALYDQGTTLAGQALTLLGA